MADLDRYPPGDKRNCPKCGYGMECKGSVDGNADDLSLWQCPRCKNVELRVG